MKASNNKKAHSHAPGETCSLCGINAQPEKIPSKVGHDKSVNKNTIEELRQKIISIVGKDPTKAGTILKDWIDRSGNHKKKA
jgi:hypothetical protein